MSPELLRAWERRYGLLQPERTPGGFRLYSEADEARVRAMQKHIASGLSAAEAARAALSPAGARNDVSAEIEPAPSAGLEAEKQALVDALAAYDESAAQAALDRLLAIFSVETIITAVVMPFLTEIGERWQQGEMSIGQEHFATNLIRGRLMALARGWDQGSGPRAVLACTPGNTHDLGLVCHGLALRARGWRISFLGADTPLSTIAETAQALSPEMVVIAAATTESLSSAEDEIRRLAAGMAVALGGPGSSEALTERVGAVHLGGSPVEAAELLTAGRDRESAR